MGYQDNKEFFDDIQKYGWVNGFSHEVIKENLTYVEARSLESELIAKYDTVKNGYNRAYSTVSNNVNFDFFDFTVFNFSDDYYKNDVTYFTRIPNMFIQTDIKKQFGLHRIFYIVWIMIDRNRNYEDVSHISFYDILTACGYKISAKRKPKVFYEVVKCLFFLKENNYIECSIDPFDISFKDSIEIKIIKKNFDPQVNFTIITGKDFDDIVAIESSLCTEVLITVYLYIKSYIIKRNKNCSENDMKPEAFWGSMESIAKKISMSKDTLNQCMQHLSATDPFANKLFIKHTVGSLLENETSKPKNVPNIYVLNEEGYEQEIKWAINKMLEVYQVDQFFPHKSGN